MPVTVAVPSTVNVDPSNVNLESSSNSPPVPAITILLFVRSSTFTVLALIPLLASSKPAVVVTPETVSVV